MEVDVVRSHEAGSEDLLEGRDVALKLHLLQDPGLQHAGPVYQREDSAVVVRVGLART